MPGFNGMGPQGAGPMTGRGRGYCMVNIAPGADFVPGFGRAGGRFVPGFGRAGGRFVPGFGRAGGRGWRNCYYATGLPGWAMFAPGMAPGSAAFNSLLSGEEELDLLKEQAVHMESALEKAKKRIKELEDKK